MDFSGCDSSNQLNAKKRFISQRSKLEKKHKRSSHLILGKLGPGPGAQAAGALAAPPVVDDGFEELAGAARLVSQRAHPAPEERVDELPRLLPLRKNEPC